MFFHYNNFNSFLKFNIFERVFYAFLKDRKLARNASALTHATGAVALNAVHILWPNAIFYNTCVAWSTGYFLYDVYFMLMYEKISKLNLAYIYHHLSLSYLIRFPPALFYTDQLLFWGELSNIPSYFVYHYLHSKPLSPKLVWWTTMQKIIYGGIRVPVLTWVTMRVCQKAPNKLPVLIALPVYFMGLAWTMKLLKK
jgi:hypothetical protein